MCCTGSFKVIATKNLDEIRKNFAIGLKRLGFDFDEDLFIDVCMKCDLTLNDKEMTKEDCIKYLWTAYNNTLRSRGSRKQIELTIDEDVYSDNPSYNDEYDINIDIICNIIKSSIRERFGEVIYNIWLDHIYNGKTYKDLIKEYGERNYMGLFRKINKFIKEKLPKLNKEYKERIENFLN